MVKEMDNQVVEALLAYLIFFSQKIPNWIEVWGVPPFPNNHPLDLTSTLSDQNDVVNCLLWSTIVLQSCDMSSIFVPQALILNFLPPYFQTEIVQIRFLLKMHRICFPSPGLPYAPETTSTNQDFSQSPFELHDPYLRTTPNTLASKI